MHPDSSLVLYSVSSFTFKTLFCLCTLHTLSGIEAMQNGKEKRGGGISETNRNLFTDAREYYILDIYYAIRYQYKTTNHLIYIIIILNWHYGQDIDKTYFKKGDVEVSKIITQCNVLLFSKRAENEYSYSYGLCKHCFVFETSLHFQG